MRNRIGLEGSPHLFWEASVHQPSVLAVAAAIEIVAGHVIGWTSLQLRAEVRSAPRADTLGSKSSGDLIARIERIALGHASTARSATTASSTSCCFQPRPLYFFRF